ncbi:hypothetical protein K474DRAFT_1773401 [Panus rudis PR-1116 ss-1]|nr:hypothetical protein K474DRAFT_1773401 [Panus rudis PR-1116 ss-1]
MLPESGRYFIIANSDNHTVARRRFEDRTLLPKGIYHLPEDNRSDPDREGWLVEKIADDKYKLTTRGDPTGLSKDVDVVAYLLPQPTLDLAWILEPTDLANVYLIKALDGTRGWTVGEPNEVNLGPVST